MKTKEQQLDFFWQPIHQIHWHDLPQAQQQKIHLLLSRFLLACLDGDDSLPGNPNQQAQTICPTETP